MVAARLPIKTLNTLAAILGLFISMHALAQDREFDDFDNAPPLIQDPLADDQVSDGTTPDLLDPTGEDQRGGFWAYFGTNLGFASFISQQSSESDKDGFQFGLKALVAYDLENWVIDFGGGWFYNRLESSPSGSAITVTTRAGFLELTPHYRLSRSWNLAWVNQFLIGTDTTFDESSSSDTRVRMLSGARVSYEVPTPSSLFRIGAQVLTDVNIQNRQILWVQLDLQIGIPLSGQKMSSASVEMPKIYDVTDTIRVTGEESVQVTLGEDSIYFRSGSRELDNKSRKFLKRFGQFLIDNEHDWKEIRVEGHTDSRGAQSLNEKLSFQRAANVREALIGVGVKTDKITAKGFGPNQPVDPKENEAAWAKNRRVELRFSGVEDPRAFAERLKDFRANL